MPGRFSYSGLIIAGIGFFLTRFTVTIALSEDPLRFVFAGVLPLSLGLALAAFGVGLAIVDVPTSTARTIAAWCVTGTVAMFVLVFLTLIGTTTSGVPDLAAVRSQAYLSNLLIGGSVGGTLTGLYAARNQHQRAETQQQANRLQILNRLLRHEVLNAVSVIQAYNHADDRPKGRQVIDEKATDIQQLIEEVKYLTRRRDSATRGMTVDLHGALTASLDALSSRYPDATPTITTGDESLAVQATPQLEQLFTHLIDDIIQRSTDESLRLDITTTPTTATVQLVADGLRFTERERKLLESGSIARYDDPTTGFELNLARLYAEDVGGSIETAHDGTTSTVTVTLRRVPNEIGTDYPFAANPGVVGPALPSLLVTVVVALLAGVSYGIVSEFLGGSIAGIGVFYGTASPVVGWITHEFHSVVFGFVYAGLLAVGPSRFRGNMTGHIAIAIGWAIVLWVFAAGVIAPIWLRLLGIPATIPFLTGRLFLSHLAWGLSLGVLTSLGYRYATPWVAERVAVLRQ